MSSTPGPPRGSADETIAPSGLTRPGSADDTLAPRPDRIDPDATIAPVTTQPDPAATIATAKPQLAETIAPGANSSRQDATIDFSVQAPAGLNATIDSIPSLSAARGSSGSAPRPEVEGYNILSELGRGGMGVVYKARQKKLNRIVALKMVLAGAHAGAEQLARFYTEAEAVAHLQQPHIVQIYEVGEHNGLPYFSLEYVDGGCLADRIGGKPQPVKEAASMVEQLARAIGYAHQQGIVHRDLKPANVLLTKEGEPKITDFGLAKRLESDSSQTKSGTLMGTPNYMAPEQARGLAKEVGPLADVYALGVILYEMLVGRTPFLGTSIIDTLQQVRNQDPVPPTRLQPKVPRDLETVCLKCLEKEPAKRYESAIALAEDLHRFVSGEPIQARPVALPERLWRWCQRNQRVAVLSAAVLLLLVSMAIAGPVAAILISQQKALAVKNEALALQNAEAARLSQAAAEANEKKAIVARNEADENAKLAAEQSRQALGAFSTLVTSVSKMRDTPATQTIKQTLLRTGLDGLRKVADSAKGGRGANAMMAQGHLQLAEIFKSMGQYPDARQQFEANFAIRKTLADAAPGELEPAQQYALSVHKLGDINLNEGHMEQARLRFSEALGLRQKIALQFPQEEQALLDLATSHVTLGDVSKPAEALQFYTEALNVRESLAARATEKTRATRQRSVWVTLSRLGELGVKTDEVGVARERCERALIMAEKLLEQLPNSGRAKLDVALSHLNMGNVQSAAGEHAAARESFAKSVSLMSPLAAEDAQNLELQANYTLALARHGEHQKAGTVASALRKLFPQNFRAQYNAACGYAACIKAVLRMRSRAELSDDEQKAVSQYTQQVIEALKTAIKLGFNDFEAMKDDSDLAVLSDSDEFLKLFPASE